MMVQFRAALICAACVLLSACATQPEIPFDKSTAGGIKSVGVYCGLPNQPDVWLATDIGQSFGLVGALIDAGMQSSRDSDFWAEIKGNQNPPRTTFDGAIMAALQARGFDAAIIDDKNAHAKFLDKYAVPAGAHYDAYLDIASLGYGYVAAGIGNSTPYRPYTYLNVRLVRASDQHVLMQDYVLYNQITGAKALVRPEQKAVTISANPDFTFVDFDTLHGDPVKARAGLDEALSKTADAVGDLLQ